VVYSSKDVVLSLSVTETRSCEECGTSFVPQREHARFCSARCRVAWNRDNSNDRDAEECALDWSAVAMREATGRLANQAAAGRAQAYVVISEAVWWVTIVDATLVRYHADAYDGALASRPAAERQAVEGTLGGLRFVRNQMGYYTDHADFVQRPDSTAGPARPPVTAWQWRPLPEPSLKQLPPSRQAWEMERYRAYQAHLAGHTMGEVFGLVADFLTQVAAQSALAVP
jgi:hypothetical protein